MYHTIYELYVNGFGEQTKWLWNSFMNRANASSVDASISISLIDMDFLRDLARVDYATTTRIGYSFIHGKNDFVYLCGKKMPTIWAATHTRLDGANNICDLITSNTRAHFINEFGVGCK